jgi:chemotaxis protein histidine kinase CheA
MVVVADGNEKFKDLFIEEANDQLGTLSAELLEIEKEPENIERYATLMRAAHTVKGAAATMGYANMARLAHALEDVFHLGERKAITMGSAEISASFVAVDRMRASLASIKEQGSELDVDAAISVLEHSTKGASTQEPNPPTMNPALPNELISALPSNVRVDVERLDALMGLFEEMLMVRLKLDSLLEPAIGITKTIARIDIDGFFFRGFLHRFRSFYNRGWRRRWRRRFLFARRE